MATNGSELPGEFLRIVGCHLGPHLPALVFHATPRKRRGGDRDRDKLLGGVVLEPVMGHDTSLRVHVTWDPSRRMHARPPFPSVHTCYSD